MAVPVGVGGLAAAGIVGVSSAVGAHGGAVVEPEAAVAKASHKPREAEATLRAADGSRVGTVTFESRGGRTVVDARIRLDEAMTAEASFHGFHVHANDRPENGTGCVADPAKPPSAWFVSADGHLADEGETHRHRDGDQPSLLVNDDGTASISFTTTRLDIAALDRRAVVIHAGPDNFGNVPTGTATDQYTPNSAAVTDETAATGNAGDRIACGVLETKR